MLLVSRFMRFLLVYLNVLHCARFPNCAMRSFSLLLLFLGVFVRNLCMSLYVLHPHPSPIPIHTFKFISLTFLWVLPSTHNVSLLKVKFVNFRLNLSLCPRCPEVIRSLSPHFQVLLYLYTFLTLFEPFFTISCAGRNL